MGFDVNKLKWTREPAEYKISENKIEIIISEMIMHLFYRWKQMRSIFLLL